MTHLLQNKQVDQNSNQIRFENKICNNNFNYDNALRTVFEFDDK